MAYNHSEIAQRFKDGAMTGKSSSMIIKGDVVYSYGHHFPLLVRMPWGYLMNGDKYSNTTSRHQSICSKLATVIIPFSALRAALREAVIPFVYPSDLIAGMVLVDKAGARWDTKGYVRRNPDTDETECISIAVYSQLPQEQQGCWSEVTERRPSACVFTYGGKCYLSSMDGNNYFISELPKHVNTVQEAFEALMPNECFLPSGVRQDILRQGEWFFIPAGNFSITGINLRRVHTWRMYALANRNRNTSTAHHSVTECKAVLGIPYVRGFVRHTRKDHPRLKLGDGRTWYMAVESNHVQSWGAGGRVD